MQFPIDLEQFDRREQLKKSGLGKVYYLFLLSNHHALKLFLLSLEAVITNFFFWGRLLCFYQNLMRKPHPIENLPRT